MNPAMSIVLATDRYQTIQGVVRRLKSQRVRERLELVIVTPDSATLGLDEAEVAGFSAVQVIEVAGPELSFPAARAAGVRASRAPVVFIGETHSYPCAGWAEALLDAHTRPWAAVAPGFANANPDGPLSWSIFLVDYGRWLAGLPAGEVVAVPTHNVAYKRAVLLELGPALDTAFAHSDALALHLAARGYRTYFEPAARMDHLNISQRGAWLSERFLCGLLVAGRRAGRWPLGRRLVYFFGSPLIPLVALGRLLPGLRLARRTLPLPAGTLAAVIVATVIAAAGEMVGYAGAMWREAEARMTEFELNKRLYAGRKA